MSELESVDADDFFGFLDCPSEGWLGFWLRPSPETCEDF